MTRLAAIAIGTAFLLACAFAAQSQEKNQERVQEKISDGVVKIGMIEDMSSIYADITGVGAVPAAKMSVEDFGGEVLGMPIEVVSADHQNKADIAAATTRQRPSARRRAGCRTIPAPSPRRYLPCSGDPRKRLRSA